MNEYEFIVTLRVKVEAYNPMDASELVEDAFGPGEDCGVEITEVMFKQVN